MAKVKVGDINLDLFIILCCSVLFIFYCLLTNNGQRETKSQMK